MHMHLLLGSSVISYENGSYDTFCNSAVQIPRPVCLHRKKSQACSSSLLRRLDTRGKWPLLTKGKWLIKHYLYFFHGYMWVVYMKGVCWIKVWMLKLSSWWVAPWSTDNKHQTVINKKENMMCNVINPLHLHKQLCSKSQIIYPVAGTKSTFVFCVMKCFVPSASKFPV